MVLQRFPFLERIVSIPVRTTPHREVWFFHFSVSLLLLDWGPGPSPAVHLPWASCVGSALCEAQSFAKLYRLKRWGFAKGQVFTFWVFFLPSLSLTVLLKTEQILSYGICLRAGVLNNIGSSSLDSKMFEDRFLVCSHALQQAWVWVASRLCHLPFPLVNSSFCDVSARLVSASTRWLL